MRTVVVGAGIMGAATAYHLARAAVPVLLVEKSSPGHATTGASFSRLSALDKTPEHYYRLNRLGIDEHAHLAAQFPDAFWYHPTGTLLWRHDGTLLDRAAQFQGWGEQLHRLTSADARDLAGPDVQLPAGADEIFFAPDEGWVDAVACTRALVHSAAALGAEVVTEEMVTALEAGARSWRAVMASGRSESAEFVVNATGTAVGELSPVDSPLVRSRGLLAEIAIPGIQMHRTVHTDRVSIRPAGPGRILARADQADKLIAAESGSRAARQELTRRVRGVLPGMPESPDVRVRIGHRVIPRGGLPVLGAVAGFPGYFQISAHSGVILGPLVGRLVAEQIITGAVPSLLVPYQRQLESSLTP